ncbi:MAG: Crp/Fnr family transcriptional regulator [Saprospiraceae bacterium]|nr:Crp/Fnr family transcriptional regulator [Saprospiraceae bacterium]
MVANFQWNTSICFEKLTSKFQYIFETELISELCASSILKKFGEGQHIIHMGELLTHMPLVLSGSIKIITENKEGEELLLYYLETGDTCAITMNCCTKPTKSIISAISESDTEILFIPIQKMDEWMVKFKSWRSFVLESYNIRMNEMLEAIDNLAFNNMEERLYKYLKNRVFVDKESKLHITHLQIANDLNSSRVVISRLMKKLEKEGKIVQYRNAVDIKDFFTK